jgi:hypothetical protein
MSAAWRVASKTVDPEPTKTRSTLHGDWPQNFWPRSIKKSKQLKTKVDPKTSSERHHVMVIGAKRWGS